MNTTDIHWIEVSPTQRRACVFASIIFLVLPIFMAWALARAIGALLLPAALDADAALSRAGLLLVSALLLCLASVTHALLLWRRLLLKLPKYRIGRKNDVLCIDDTDGVACAPATQARWDRSSQRSAIYIDAKSIGLRMFAKQQIERHIAPLLATAQPISTSERLRFIWAATRRLVDAHPIHASILILTLALITAIVGYAGRIELPQRMTATEVRA